MHSQKKKFKDLDLSNAFLFAEALADEETCRLVLETVQEENVGAVKVTPERTILCNSNFRYVRLDIYAHNQVGIGFRFHQAELDVASLKPGENFKNLKPCTVIFICAFDPFQKGLYRYSFEEHCAEVDIPLGDGTRKIFLNIKGKNPEEVPEVLVHFLKYVENSTDDFVEDVADATITKLHEKITALKSSRELEDNYMQLEELFQQREKEGVEAGIKVGREESVDFIGNEWPYIIPHITK
ncbi:MAG: hypothetical protein RR869_00260 [Lachnospiraceae bacterium]